MEPKHIGEMLVQITDRNLGLQTQESKQLVSGEEKKLQIALKSRLIKDCSFDELKEVLKLVMVKVGLRSQNWPNDLEKLVLVEHIISNFGGNRLEEIKLAFDMAITGKLCDDDGVVISANCFENFSCLYFSSIMAAYRFWSVQAFKHIPKEGEPEQRIFTEEENDNALREDAERQYRAFLRGLKLKGTEFNKSILVKDGLLNESGSVLGLFKEYYEKGYRHIYVRK